MSRTALFRCGRIFATSAAKAAGSQAGPPAQSSSASTAASVASATSAPTDPYGVAAIVSSCSRVNDWRS